MMAKESNQPVQQQMLRKLTSIAYNFRLPSICALCNQYHTHTTALCSKCRPSLRLIGPACLHCALPLPDNQYQICGQCAVQRPHFSHVFTSYRFTEPLRTLLHEFKYRQGLHLRTALVELMLENVPPLIHTTGCLIPVPIHPARLRHRGFNQAAELTKLLARTLNLPYHLSLCCKIKNTPAQAQLSFGERRRNLRGAFGVNHNDYQHITLVDDLLTTGSTANELAKTLKAHGAWQVDVWCCARAI